MNFDKKKYQTKSCRAVIYEYGVLITQTQTHLARDWGGHKQILRLESQWKEAKK